MFKKISIVLECRYFPWQHSLECRYKNDLCVHVFAVLVHIFSMYFMCLHYLCKDLFPWWKGWIQNVHVLCKTFYWHVLTFQLFLCRQCFFDFCCFCYCCYCCCLCCCFQTAFLLYMRWTLNVYYPNHYEIIFSSFLLTGNETANENDSKIILHNALATIR